MKKILFVTKDMSSSGVTTSLINFLKELSNDKTIELELLLDVNSGEYIKDIPSNVKVKTIKYKKDYLDYRVKLKDAYKQLSKINFVKYFINKLLINIFDKISKKKIHEDKIIKNIVNDNEEYDLIIDFQGYGFYLSKYIAKYIKGNKKVMFIHDENLSWFNSVESYFKYYDYFCCVSNYVKDKFIQEYPLSKDKAIVVYNLINDKEIKKLSKEECDIKFDNNYINLVTVGRLAYQKGYDLLIDSAIKLKNDNVNFKWYIIGNGYLENELKDSINNNGLNDNVYLLGLKKNPYPYMKNCDIYVQTSRHEGFGITIAEAKILGKVIVSTNLGPIREQIDNNINGILCEFDVNDLTDKIKSLINDKDKKIKIEENLKEFKYANKEQIEKILDLIK